MNNAQSASLADYLPLWHFDNDILVFSDGALGVGFELKGRDISVAETERVNEFSAKLENLLNTAQERLRFQVFYRLDSHVSDSHQCSRGIVQRFIGGLCDHCQCQAQPFPGERAGGPLLSARNIFLRPKCALCLQKAKTLGIGQKVPADCVFRLQKAQGRFSSSGCAD